MLSLWLWEVTNTDHLLLPRTAAAAGDETAEAEAEADAASEAEPDADEAKSTKTGSDAAAAATSSGGAEAAPKKPKAAGPTEAQRVQVGFVCLWS